MFFQYIIYLLIVVFGILFLYKNLKRYNIIEVIDDDIASSELNKKTQELAVLKTQLKTLKRTKSDIEDIEKINESIDELKKEISEERKRLSD